MIRIVAFLICLLPAVASADVHVDAWTARWCEPCRRMEPIIQRLQREHYAITIRDYDVARQIADQQGVRQVPSFVVIRDGQVELILEGEVDERTLRDLFTEPACDPADAAPSLPLPGPSEPDEDWKASEEVPPAPKPLPPKRDPYRPDDKPTAMEPISNNVDLHIYGFDLAAGSASGSSDQSTDRLEAHDSPPKESAASNDALATAGKVAKTAAAFTMPLWAPYVGGPIAGALLLSLATRLIRRRQQGGQVGYAAPVTDSVQPPPVQINRAAAVDCSSCTTIADLRDQLARRPVVYKTPPIDDGLGRMRRVMAGIGEEYPSFRNWIRLIEKTYSLELSGEQNDG